MATRTLGPLFLAGLFLALPLATAQSGAVPGYRDPITPGCHHLEYCDPVRTNLDLNGHVPVRDTDDKPVRVILYAHFQDLFLRAPLNTQPPHPELEPDVNRGFLLPTLTTEPEELPCCSWEYNRFLMQSSPGPVEYLPDGHWRTHQEPGLAAGVRILPIDGHYIYGYWYMSPRSLPDTLPGAEPESVPGVMPTVGVMMQLNLGRFATDDPEKIIARGDTGLGYRESPDAARLGQTVTMLQRPGDDAVYEFKVPMRIQNDYLPPVWDPHAAGRGFVVRVVPYQIETEHAAFTQADWRLRTGIDHPPRIVFDVASPLQTTWTSIRTFSAAGLLYFQWAFVSPWGTYDVDPESARLEVTGPGGPLDVELVSIRHAFDYDAHFKPVNATWRYDYGNNPFLPGTYHVQGSVLNRQGTYMLTWTETFTVDWRAVRAPNLFSPRAAEQEVSDTAGQPVAVLGAFGLLLGSAAAAALLTRRLRLEP